MNDSTAKREGATSPAVALVTGGNKGIGRETVRLLSERGMTLWLGARDPERGEDAAIELRKTGGDVRLVQLDVTDPSTVEAAAKEIDTAHGRLDILVNNAGIAGQPLDVPPSEVTTAQVRDALETNLLGVVTVTNAFLPLLRKAEQGKIVNVSSSLGSIAMTAADPDRTALLAYNTSKAALNMATVLWANELAGSNVTANLINPGFCATDLNGFQGVLSAAEGADAVVNAVTADSSTNGTFLSREGTVPW